MSPRTTKYIEAMVREGDNFDYYKWLKEVREEEARVKQFVATHSSGELVAAEIGKPMGPSSDNQHLRPKPVLPLIPKKLLVPTAIRRPHRHAKSQTPKARIRRRLEKVRAASGEFQASRSRDAVYDYLESVFAIVEHYRVRRRTHRLLQHAFKFANLPFDKNAGAFSAVIRCTSDRYIDIKTISKWARALRYVARCKKPDTGLKKFMKRAGGLNGCAARYAQRNG